MLDFLGITHDSYPQHQEFEVVGTEKMFAVHCPGKLGACLQFPVSLMVRIMMCKIITQTNSGFLLSIFSGYLLALCLFG
jgi:hypothetical protein